MYANKDQHKEFSLKNKFKRKSRSGLVGGALTFKAKWLSVYNRSEILNKINLKKKKIYG